MQIYKFLKLSCEEIYQLIDQPENEGYRLPLVGTRAEYKALCGDTRYLAMIDRFYFAEVPTMNVVKEMELYEKAIEVGCKVKWYDGMFGPAWHCGCEDGKHHCDQQCSMITLDSLAR